MSACGSYGQVQARRLTTRRLRADTTTATPTTSNTSSAFCAYASTVLRTDTPHLSDASHTSSEVGVFLSSLASLPSSPVARTTRRHTTGRKRNEPERKRHASETARPRHCFEIINKIVKTMPIAPVQLIKWTPPGRQNMFTGQIWCTTTRTLGVRVYYGGLVFHCLSVFQRSHAPTHTTHSPTHSPTHTHTARHSHTTTFTHRSTEREGLARARQTATTEPTQQQQQRSEAENRQSA